MDTTILIAEGVFQIIVGVVLFILCIRGLMIVEGWQREMEEKEEEKVIRAEGLNRERRII